MSQITKFFRVFLTTCVFAVCFCIGTNHSAHAGPGNFFVTVNGKWNSLYFAIAAKGDFYVDCGSGGELYDSSNTRLVYSNFSHSDATRRVYHCFWPSGSEHTITFDGSVTQYSNDTNHYAAISFFDAGNFGGAASDNSGAIARIKGSLGAIFKTIDGGLTNGVVDATKQPRFYQTFKGAEQLYDGLTNDLFAGVYGPVVSYMFAETFSGCSHLTQTIPMRLFAGLTGGAEHMFDQTFAGCGYEYTVSGHTYSYGIYGPLPDNLFSGITSAEGYGFYQTFKNCINLGKNSAGGSRTYYIPPTLFGGLIEGIGQAEFMTDIFVNTGLLNDTAGQGCPVMTERYQPTGLWNRWNESAWTNNYSGNYKVSCIDKTPFQVETINLGNNSKLSWTISASGSDFFFDCGDGGTLYENNVSTGGQSGTFSWNYANGERLYHCFYETSGTRKIRFAGTATAYNPSVGVPAIAFGNHSSFNNMTPKNIYKVYGSLGKIFPTLSNTSTGRPQFSQTFSKAESLVSVPAELFSYQENGAWKGVTGSRNFMFYSTFLGCSNLTEIPDYLFGGTTGVAPNMFESTFSECGKLITIHSHLFGGFSGAADSMFKYTFFKDDNLASIPTGLFAGTLGADVRMFEGTFSGCYSLAGAIPANLFGGTARSGCASFMFNETFKDCSKLTEIPSTLFGNSGNCAADSMFASTFYNCASIGRLPSGLFSWTRGSAIKMFLSTFEGCSDMYGPIPSNLFGSLTSETYPSSDNADDMFVRTFYGDKMLGIEPNTDGLPKYSIPQDLFRNIPNGTSSGMVSETFKYTGLLECCPIGFRRLTDNDANTGVSYNSSSGYNMANFVTTPGYDGKVVCISGTAAEDEVVLNPVDHKCNLKSCGKKLKTKMPGQNGAISEYLLLHVDDGVQISGTVQKVKFSVPSNNNTDMECYIPAKQQAQSTTGLNIKKNNNTVYRPLAIDEW